jgi:hypothetical protein
MALTPSGAISLGDINTALGRSATASININDGDVRFLANQDSGSVTMNNMRNKYWFNGTVNSINWLADGNFYGSSRTFGGSVTGVFQSAVPEMYTEQGIGTYIIPFLTAVSDIGAGRFQVGSGPVGITLWEPSDFGNFYAVYGTECFTSADVGVTRAWRWATA